MRINALALAAVLAASGFGLQAMAATTPQEETRPEWCRVGYICVPTTIAADLSAKLINLEAENQALRMTKKHVVGWAAVIGPSATLDIQNGKTDFRGTLSFTIGPGFRW